MPKYIVTEPYTIEGEHRWIVDADSPEEAEQEVRDGNVEMHRDKVWSEEGDDLTVEDITDESN